MATRPGKQLPEERRRAEASLSEFAEYVEKQQALRYGASNAETTTTTTTTTTKEADVAAGSGGQHHAELDELLDGLDLTGAEPQVVLKGLLLGDDDATLDKLCEVLAQRITEDGGETVFDVGFENNGDSMGLDRKEFDAAFARLEIAARRAGAECELLLTRNVTGGPVEPADAAAAAAEVGGGGGGSPGKDCSGKVLVRRVPCEVGAVIETRVAVVGNVDAGKSSMIGVLVKGDLDDGRGKARVNLFRHKHEMETGRTSSVGLEILGFDAKGAVVKSDVAGRKLSWEEIGKRSAKVITFSDLAGHERYLRTTVFGLLSSSLNYCLLMVAANHGLTGMSKEHLGIALSMHVPIMVVVTKIDTCPAHILADTMSQITRILKSPGARKVPILIRSRHACVTTATQFGPRLCPIFQVSNVTGENLDLVRLFLNIIPHHGRYDVGAPLEMRVNDTFSVPFVGTVVSGVIKSGVVHEGDDILIGPDPLGRFAQTVIRSIERKRLRVPAAVAGQSVSFALKKVKRKDVRKGMQTPQPPVVELEFVAEVLILSHATTIKPNYQAMLHVGSVSQTCAIIAMDRELIRTGDRATVVFRFTMRPEYIMPGDRILFRDGRTKGLGIVKQVGYKGSKPMMDSVAS